MAAASPHLNVAASVARPIEIWDAEELTEDC
jgi:hypothetical protein